MASKVSMKGAKEVSANLNRELRGITGRSVAGLMAGGLIVERQAKQWTPREYGNLVNSAYTRVAQNNPNAVEVGFGAAYAIYVHENLQQKWKGRPRRSGLGQYWGPQGRPRFLAEAMTAKQKEVVATVAKYAQVGGGSKK